MCAVPRFLCFMWFLFGRCWVFAWGWFVFVIYIEYLRLMVVCGIDQ